MIHSDDSVQGVSDLEAVRHHGSRCLCLVAGQVVDSHLQVILVGLQGAHRSLQELSVAGAH